jgi:hypothetical protein
MNGITGTLVRRSAHAAANGGFVVGGTSAPGVEDYG